MRPFLATILVLLSAHSVFANSSLPARSPVEALVQIQRRYIEEQRHHIPALMLAHTLEKFAEQAFITNHAPELVRFFIEALVAASNDLSGGRAIRRTGNYNNEDLPERDYLGRAANTSIVETLDPLIRARFAESDLFNSIIAEVMKRMPKLKKHYILGTLIAHGDNYTETARKLQVAPEQLIHVEVRLNLKTLAMEGLGLYLPKSRFVQSMIHEEERAALVAEGLLSLQTILHAPTFSFGTCASGVFGETLDQRASR